MLFEYFTPFAYLINNTIGEKLSIGLLQIVGVPILKLIRR